MTENMAQFFSFFIMCTELNDLVLLLNKLDARQEDQCLIDTPHDCKMHPAQMRTTSSDDKVSLLLTKSAFKTTGHTF